MTFKPINLWLIACLFFFLAIPTEFVSAKEFLQFQWRYDITNGGQSPTYSHWIKSVTDTSGNQSLVVSKVDENSSYIDILDAKTGKLLWSMPESDSVHILSDDGIIFIFNDNQISAKHVASGKTIWAAPLPIISMDTSNYYWLNYSYPSKNGSIYVVGYSMDYTSSTVYYYDTKGNFSQKFKVPYLIQQIEGNLIISQKLNDHPDFYVNSLLTGYRIGTITGGKGYNRMLSLTDGTLLHLNIYKKTTTIKAYNNKGQITWTKQFPYVDYLTELYTIKDRFLFLDVKNKRIKLYSSSGKLIAEKAYLPEPRIYTDFYKLINLADDGTSFMFTSVKNGKDELVIMDTSNLNILSTYKNNEFDLQNEFLYLNDTTGLYVISDEGRTLVSNQLIK